MNLKHTLTIGLLLFATLHGSIAETKQPVLKFNAEKKFKIVQFTDVHVKHGNPKSDIALQRIAEVLKAEKPDLVVLDIKMGDYNGLDLLQDIRNRYYDIPVILCSAYDTFQHDMKSMAADNYVIKSFDLAELKNKIAELLG